MPPPASTKRPARTPRYSPAATTGCINPTGYLAPPPTSHANTLPGGSRHGSRIARYADCPPLGPALVSKTARGWTKPPRVAS
eukprot:10983263-Lingulodinium_polyedra.AAC.1